MVCVALHLMTLASALATKLPTPVQNARSKPPVDLMSPSNLELTYFIRLISVHRR